MHAFRTAPRRSTFASGSARLGLVAILLAGLGAAGRSGGTSADAGIESGIGSGIGSGSTVAASFDRAPRSRSFQFAERMPFALCFAPGTPHEEAERVQNHVYKHWLSLQEDGGLAFNLTTQWSFASGPNSPITLRWSVAPDGIQIPDAAGVGSGANQINAKLASTFGSVEEGKEVIRELFAIWGELSGVTYVEVEDDGASWGAPGSSTRGDVRIGAHGFTNANVLGYNQFPQDGDMVLNGAISWGSPADDYLFFRNVFMHEHGHGLGILHVCPANETKLMEPFLSTAFFGPQHDDIRAVQRHYGDALEPNGDAVEAVDLGGPGSEAILAPISIADASDRDWFRFEAAEGSVLDVAVAPDGFTYNSGSQFLFFCLPGSSVNSLTVHDLALRVLAADGSTVVAESDEAPAGQVESITGLVLGAGTYFLEVSGGFASSVQLYGLEFSVSEGEDPPSPADLDGDGVVNGEDLAILLANWGDRGALGDVDGNGIVDGADLAQLLGSWG